MSVQFICRNDVWEVRLPAVPRVGDEVRISGRAFVVQRLVWHVYAGLVDVHLEALS